MKVLGHIVDLGHQLYPQATHKGFTVQLEVLTGLGYARCCLLALGKLPGSHAIVGKWVPKD